MSETLENRDGKADLPKKAKPEPIKWDRLFRGVLTRLGDTLDRITGRNRDASSIATSQLIKRLLAVIESEKRTVEGKCVFVPHNIRLKLQWDKFSDEDEESINKLRDELSIAAMDHINDHQYFTEAPLNLEVKKDYFVDGVKILVSFEDLSAVDLSAAEANVTMAGSIPSDLSEPGMVEDEKPLKMTFHFKTGKGDVTETVAVATGDRIKIGRHISNDIVIDDPSVSKFHCSLVMGTDGSAMIADTGSTNGTTINGERIDYGKTVSMERGGIVCVGDITVEVTFEAVTAPDVEIDASETPDEVGMRETGA
ncbi:MAG: FHA domain-containing protein [Acidobacteriota bacterium]|nr:MAG: FHA domain-containing protein [Acidobacteriota bacterium]